MPGPGAVRDAARSRHEPILRHARLTGGAPMTTTPTRGRLGLEEHGIAARGRVVRNPTTSQLYSTHSDAVTAVSPRAARWPSTPACTRVVRRGTSSSSRSPARRSASGGETSIIRCPRRSSTACARRSPPTCRPRIRSTSSMHFAGADPAHRIVVRVVTGSPYHALFAKTMFIEPDEDELESPRAPGPRAPRPRGRGGARGGRRPAPARSWSCTRREPRCSSAEPSTPARSRSRSSR